MAPSQPSKKQTSPAKATPKASHKTSTADNASRVTKKPAAKSKPRKSTANQVRTDVLLCIKQIDLARIVTQMKTHDFRKYRLPDGVVRLWFYEGADHGRGCSSITHIAVIPASTRLTPGSVPTLPIGYGNEAFNSGIFKNDKFAYPILELFKLDDRISLEEMKSGWGMSAAPVGWRYVEREMWEDRWAGEKVKKIF